MGRLDGRYVCPECGRAAIAPEFPPFDLPLRPPAYGQDYWEARRQHYDRQMVARGGRYHPGETQECVSGHSWIVPEEEAEAEAEKE